MRPLLIGILLLSAAPLRAQVGANDSGTFQIWVSGRAAGEETFEIRQSGAGGSAEVVATGRVEMVMPTGQVDLATRLQTSGFQVQASAYEVRVGGSTPQRFVGSLGGGRFTARIATTSGEQMREFVASPAGIVLDDGVAHQYYFLARRTRNGRVPVILPRENRQLMATVRDAGAEEIEVDGQTVLLFRLTVEPDGGDLRHVWLDDLGRVIRVEIPSRGYLAVRTVLPQ